MNVLPLPNFMKDNCYPESHELEPSGTCCAGLAPAALPLVPASVRLPMTIILISSI